MKKETMHTVNQLVAGICEGGAAKLASDAMFSFVPGGKIRLISKIMYTLGSVAFGTMVGSKTGEFAKNGLDDVTDTIIDSIEEVKAAVKEAKEKAKEAEVEEDTDNEE